MKKINAYPKFNMIEYIQTNIFLFKSKLQRDNMVHISSNRILMTIEITNSQLINLLLDSNWNKLSNGVFQCDELNQYDFHDVFDFHFDSPWICLYDEREITRGWTKRIQFTKDQHAYLKLKYS